MSERAILHVDMDAFFAAVEVLDDPSLAGRPVIVGGRPEQRGVVAAASYEARRFGVHSAMSAARAARLCPEATWLPGRHARYAEISALIFALLRSYTPLVEPLSIDEAFLDVTGCGRLFGDPVAIARGIKARLRREIGLTGSVGVAPNKFLAKLASDLEKPDGLVVVPAGGERAFLAPLPVERLWGVGPRTAAVLHGLGVERIGRLAAAADALAAGAAGPDLALARRLQERLGPEHSAHLLRLCRGEDERPVVPEHEAKSIGHETTFAADIADADRLRDVLDQLADRTARRLRAHGLEARTVQLKARYADFTTVTRAATLALPTAATVTIRDEARRLLADRLGRAGRPLRLLGVSVSGLQAAGSGQGDLFAEAAGGRARRLDGVVDRLRGKHGGVIRWGAAGPPDAVRGAGGGVEPEE